MMDHILTQDIFDNHRIQLIKLILEYYIGLRIYVKLHTNHREKHKDKLYKTNIV